VFETDLRHITDLPERGCDGLASIQLAHDRIERWTNASTAMNHRVSYKSDSFLVKDVDAWRELARSLQLER
jgi:hypothetical protein